jgi:muramidase (phage lysozyme)
VLVVVMSTSVSWADSPMAKSLYRGKHWTPALSDCREAIMRRESNFNYRAANRTSSARGAYQFLDSQWRESLVHMMRKETRQDYPERLDRLEQLNDTPIHRWPRWFQDHAFYRVANGTPNGLKHWHPLPSSCR